MKFLVETPDGAPLMDPTTGDHISGVRPSVVQPTSFIKGLAQEARLKVLCELTDEADDTALAKAHREGDMDDYILLVSVEPAPVKKGE